MTFKVMKYLERVQAEIYDEIKEMSPEEEVAYFRTRAESGPLGEWWKHVKRETAIRKGYVDPQDLAER